MYRTPSLPVLAQLLFKGHFELRELLASLQADTTSNPLEFGMTCGGTRSSISLGQHGVLKMSFYEDNKGYDVRIPTRPVDGRLPKVELTLKTEGETSTHAVDATDFVGAKVPEAFAALHARVVSHLKKTLPPALAEAFGLSDNKRAKPEATAAADETSAAVSPAPAPATDEPKFVLYRVHREGQQDLQFQGRVLSRVASAPFRGRQYLFEVFQTPGGKFVALKTGLTAWLGERDKTEVTVVSTKEELVPFFGYSALAKALYEQLELSTVETIE